MSPTFWDLMPSHAWLVDFPCRHCGAIHGVRWAISIPAGLFSVVVAFSVLAIILETAPSSSSWVAVGLTMLALALVWRACRNVLLDHLTVLGPQAAKRRARRKRQER